MILTDVGLVERKTRILKVKDSKQRDKEIALWVSELLDRYCLIDPPPIPTQVAEYYKFNPEVRKKMNLNPKEYEKFWNNPIISAYFDEKKRNDNLNDSHLELLLWAKNILQNEPIVVDIDAAIRTHTNKPIQTQQFRQKIEQPSWQD